MLQYVEQGDDREFLAGGKLLHGSAKQLQAVKFFGVRDQCR